MCELVPGAVADGISSKRGEGERDDGGCVGVTDAGGVGNGSGAVISPVELSLEVEDMRLRPWSSRTASRVLVSLKISVR